MRLSGPCAWLAFAGLVFGGARQSSAQPSPSVHARAAPVAAARPGADESQGASRILGDHGFIPLQSVIFPFASTYFGFFIGGGISTITASGYDEEGNALGEIKSSMALISEGFELGIRITDWVGLRGRFQGMVLAGTTLDDLLSGIGANFAYSFEGGVVGRLYAGKQLRVGLAAHFNYAGGRLIRIGDALSAGFQKALDPASSELDQAAQDLKNGTIDLNEFISSMGSSLKEGFRETTNNLMLVLSHWSITPAAVAAYSPAHFLGIQSSFGYSYAKTKIKKKDDSLVSEGSLNGLDWGIGLTFDARNLFFPIAVPVAYKLSATLGEGSGAEHFIETGLYYSGRTNLDLGLAFLANLKRESQKDYNFGFRMAYVW